MKSPYIDFRALKRVVSFSQVLNLYRISGLKENANGRTGCCPLHGGSRADEFHIQLERNLYNCFTCGRGGDVLSFVAEMEECSVREAAVRLVKALHLERHLLVRDGGYEEEWRPPARRANPPLGFKLQLDHEHPYLHRRGISLDTARAFGVGYYSGGGMMQGRMVVTITNDNYEPIAFVGRSIDGRLPVTLYPPGFRKSQELYNYGPVARMADASFEKLVIVVQDFFPCLWLHEHLQDNVVALMGNKLYPDQEHLLLRAFEVVILMLDGDAAGKDATQRILGQLEGKVARGVVDLPRDTSPDGVSWSVLGPMIRDCRMLDEYRPAMSELEARKRWETLRKKVPPEFR